MQCQSSDTLSPGSCCKSSGSIPAESTWFMAGTWPWGKICFDNFRLHLCQWSFHQYVIIIYHHGLVWQAYLKPQYQQFHYYHTPTNTKNLYKSQYTSKLLGTFKYAEC